MRRETIGVQKPHKKLDAWKLAMDLAVSVYKATEEFPREERFGLTSQIRRAAVSIASNIAEGCARRSKKEFIRFLHMARGSLSELDSQCELAGRLGFLKETDLRDLDHQMERVDMTLAGLLRFQKSSHV